MQFFYKNLDLEKIKKINLFINRTGQTLYHKTSTELLSNFKFCPVTLIDIERSFLAYETSYYYYIKCSKKSRKIFET